MGMLALRGHHDHAPFESDPDQALEKLIRRAGQAEVKDIGTLVQGEGDGLRQGEGAASRGAVPGHLPAGLQRQDADVGGDADDAESVVRAGGDDAGDGGPV